MKYQAEVQAPQEGGSMDAYLRENERINRWHQTYNAAVTGILAGNSLAHKTVVRRDATEVANETHGPL